eukprot:TRINITY_DN25824_c0_g1_i1.p1 TRINITY_DN25824_c0_g1~~TRINITY_DN25824_c0_g1_i1.p1  ORF type:complete len:298 (+),score=96.27 TRINITY_DN25824_c0_g1_i1:100-993(+)
MRREVVAAAVLRPAHRQLRFRTQSPNQYAQLRPGGPGQTGGAYGRGSAPFGWMSGPAKYEEEQPAEWSSESVKKYKPDLTPRTWDEMDGKMSGKTVFRMKLEKKTQAEIDAEEAAEKPHLPNLSDAQRASIRMRKRRRDLKEATVERLHAALRFFNPGRRNLGVLNKGDWNTGFLNKGDHNTGFLCFGDHNKGVLLFGNDNRGFLVKGSGNIGSLIFGDQNRGVDIWGDKMSGVCQTADDYVKARIKIMGAFFVVFVVVGLRLYSHMRDRRARKQLEAMDFAASDDAVQVMVHRKGF